ncbi:MAG: transporter substrate-binding domain-containing protein [Treponema sp.]|nr:transporter substrate-binding domain-containing protein [Treponema sp.]
MTAVIKNIKAGLFLICAVSGFFTCSQQQLQIQENRFDIISFRNIPGITDEEIEAIEALKKSRSHLIYGSMPSTEAFTLPDGTNAGFTTFFCSLLSELFGIPFVQEILSWDTMKEKLDIKTIDFTGELTSTPERELEYFMTYPIAERSLSVFTPDHVVITELSDLNNRRIGFYADTITAESILAVYSGLNFEIVDVYDEQEIFNKIASGEIEMFIDEAAATFILSGNLIPYNNIFPLIYTPVSMTTANPELAPVISAVNKYITAGGIDKIYDLYIKGDLEYAKFDFYKSLTDTEKEYLNNLLKTNKKIPISLETHNYPVSFYNRNDKYFQGIAPDVLREITMLAGIEFENISGSDDSWNTTLQKLISGEAAMVSELLQTESRIGSFLWPEKPLATTKYVLVSKIDYPFLEPYQVIRANVGLVKNSALQDVFLNMFPHHDKILFFDNNDSCFDALEHGKVDLLMLTEIQFLTLFHYLEKPGYKVNISFNSPVVESFFGFNINEDILMPIINKALIKINTDRIEKDWVNRSFNYERIMADQRVYYSNQILTLMSISFVILLSLIIVLVILFIKNKRTQELFKNEAVTLNAIFNSNPDLLLCKDASGKFTKVNNSFKKFLELDDDKILGKAAKDVYTYNDNFLKLTNESDKKVLASDTLIKFEDFAYNRNGRQVFFDVIKTPLISNGKTIGLLGIMRDITDYKDMLLKYKLTNDAAGINLWDMVVIDSDPVNPNNYFTWSKEFRNALGFNDESDFPNVLHSWSDRLHPEDKECVLTAFEAHISDYTGNTPYDIEYRLMMSNGQYRYFHALGTTLRDSNGTPLRVVGTLMDIEEKMQMTNTIKNREKKLETTLTELAEAKDLAEQSNRAKSFFLAQMSHEIRTPINAILGISEIFLQNKNISTEIMIGGASCNEVSRAEEGFRKIYESGSLLTNIINDILDFSKIEADKLEIIPKKYDVPIFINDSVQLNRIRYDNKPIDFFLQLDENMPAETIGDELRIRQILNNLLSNAYKYTEKGKIKLSVSFEQGDGETIIFVFKVSDTGQGMNDDQLSRLFNEYERFNMDTNHGITGTGLGMNITKRLIGLMNGEITAESNVGIGSIFTVRIPQKKCGSVICSKEIIESLQNFSYRGTSLLKNEQIIHEYMPDNKVLIVDDVKSNLFVAKGLMLPYGLQIETAENGLEAIEKIKNGNLYDIIFMDHMMPKMNGIDAVKIMRDMGYIHPIVALTANAIHGQEEVFLSNGFNDFLSKPIDSRELDLILLHFIRDKNVFSAKQKSDTNEKPQLNSARDKITEVEKYFALDVNNTLNVLSELVPKLHNLNDEELEMYTITVHGIKSALANIGENKLSDEALKLEQAGDNHDFNIIVNETPAFIDALQSLLNIKYSEKT